MIDDRPDYDISELPLVGLCIAGAISSLILAGHCYAHDAHFDAMESAGVALMLMGGCVDPKKSIMDCITFPFEIAERAGRDTRITMVAAGGGLALWLAGLGLNYFYGLPGFPG